MPGNGEEIAFRAAKKIVFPPRVIQGNGQEGYDILSLAISPKDEFLIALTDDLLLYCYPMKKRESSLKRNVFAIFQQPFHSNAIKGLDVCHRKPLIVTGSLDHTIRLVAKFIFQVGLSISDLQPGFGTTRASDSSLLRSSTRRSTASASILTASTLPLGSLTRFVSSTSSSTT